MCYNHQINFYEELPVGLKGGSEKKWKNNALSHQVSAPQNILKLFNTHQLNVNNSSQINYLINRTLHSIW